MQHHTRTCLSKSIEFTVESWEAWDLGTWDFGLQALTLHLASHPSTGISNVLGLLGLLHMIGLLATKPASPVEPFPRLGHSTT